MQAIAGLAALALFAAAWPACSQPPPPDAEGVPPVVPNVSRPGICAPAGLFMAVTRNISPGLAATSPLAQPMTIWRLGSLYLRSEQQPDPVRGDQRLMIVAEPDVWIINQATRRGTHQVDPGPDFEVHAPILPVQGLPGEFLSLEYGCEREFVAKYAPAEQRAAPYGSIQAGLHVAGNNEHAVAILMDKKRNTPLLISYLRQGKPVFVVRYDQYRLGLPERPNLFQPPRGVVITEAPARAPAPAPKS